MNDIKRIILASRFKEYEYMTGEPIKKRIIKTVNSLNNLSKEVKNSFIEAINIKEINNDNFEDICKEYESFFNQVKSYEKIFNSNIE